MMESFFNSKNNSSSFHKKNLAFLAEYRMQAVKFRNEIDIEPCWSKYSTKTDRKIRLSQIRIEKEINPDDEIIIPDEKDK